MRNRISNRRLFLARVAAQVLAICLLIGSDALIQESAAQPDSQTHLYFFTNEGCAPCRQVEPGIEALKREGYPVTTIYLNDHPEWGSRFQVDRTPTVIMISDNKMVGRHAGLIDAVTLKKWFAAVGVKSGSLFADAKGNQAQAGGTKVLLAEPKSQSTQTGVTGGFASPTMHKGTTRPGNSKEKRAMQATVRLKVEDNEGTSYATGTVVHSHQGESLVVTCGHVFRDAQGKGRITAEYGFGEGQTKTATGELIFYDADARDIGLVAIRTPNHIAPVPIASIETSIDRGCGIFSIGCDHGDAPTIRHSQIKNRAAYDGAIKYDIFGRPVDGRSGGGLFTEDGELIGVCNAAAVEVDEGIYTALDTIYWQLAKVNLDHLFNGDTRIAAAQTVVTPGPGSLASATGSSRQWRTEPSGVSEPGSRLARIQRTAPAANAARTAVSWDNHSTNREVIIIIRSKSNPSNTDAITISDPTPHLLNFLETMSDSQSRQLDVARLRTENQVQRR